MCEENGRKELWFCLTLITHISDFIFCISETPKRNITEVSTPESSRPRREIKRPRRYSPEPDIKDTPKSASSESGVRNEVKANKTVVEVKSVQPKGVSVGKLPKGLELKPVIQTKTPNVSKTMIKKTVPMDDDKKGTEKEKGISEEDSVPMETEDSLSDLDEVDEDTDDDNDDVDDDDNENDEDDGQKTSDENPDLAVLLAEGKEEMKVIEDDFGFMCSICDSKFRTEKACLQHGAKKMCFKNCGLCGKVFKKSQTLEYSEHQAKHQNGEKFSCTNCKKVFFEKSSLDIHQLTHRGEKKVVCPECGEKFYTSFQLSAHLLKVHKKHKFNCDICQAKFVNISFMKMEVLFDGELSYFKCVMCAN